MMTEGEPEIGNGETNLVLRQIATNHDRCNSEILVTALDRALEFKTHIFLSKFVR